MVPAPETRRVSDTTRQTIIDLLEYVRDTNNNKATPYHRYGFGTLTQTARIIKSWKDPDYILWRNPAISTLTQRIMACAAGSTQDHRVVRDMEWIATQWLKRRHTLQVQKFADVTSSIGSTIVTNVVKNTPDVQVTYTNGNGLRERYAAALLDLLENMEWPADEFTKSVIERLDRLVGV